MTRGYRPPDWPPISGQKRVLQEERARIDQEIARVEGMLAECRAAWRGTADVKEQARIAQRGADLKDILLRLKLARRKSTLAHTTDPVRQTPDSQQPSAAGWRQWAGQKVRFVRG